MVAYLGIDLTSGAGRDSAAALLDGEGRLLWAGFVRGDDEIVALVEGRRPWVTAVDAPLGLPRGLCCLEETCPCRPVWPDKGRRCERELSRRGIPLYYTTKRSIIKAMVYRAIALAPRLRQEGTEVIEVYPYASKVALFGRPIPPKTTPRGLAFSRERLSSLVPRLSSWSGPFNHDVADALVAAYTALLHHRGRTELLGVPDEVQIAVPLPDAAVWTRTPTAG